MKLFVSLDRISLRPRKRLASSTGVMTALTRAETTRYEQRGASPRQNEGHHSILITSLFESVCTKQFLALAHCALLFRPHCTL